jgi:hypothetical protein
LALAGDSTITNFIYGVLLIHYNSLLCTFDLTQTLDDEPADE